MKTVIKLLELLSPDERAQAMFLLVVIVLMALLDTVGVASIMPFMAVLSNPELIQSNEILAVAYTTLGFTSTRSFLFFLGLIVFLFIVASLIFKSFATYLQVRFALMREHSIGRRLVEGYLHQPYSWFLNRHSAELETTILSEVNQVIYQALLPVTVVIAQSLVATCLLLLLIVVDGKLALFVGLGLGLAYAGILKLVSKYLSGIGKERVVANKSRYTAISEAFGAIKSIKIGNFEDVFIERFSQPAEIYAKHQAAAQVVAQLPKFALEAIAFGGMLLVVLYLMAGTNDFATALPIIAVYTFAAYRMLPALQQVYTSLATMRYANTALDALHDDLFNVQKPVQDAGKGEDIVFDQHIRLTNLTFTYSESSRPALSNLNIEIPFRSTVGFVGTTGSGKTTTIDLILALLVSDNGSLEVDGVAINRANRRQWQKKLGYVPQDIFLSDDTIASNIAFGLTKDKIDHNKVVSAAKTANLHDFVSNELPLAYETTVGERGVRLSGGQKQRIGLARALYHSPEVLILDEATSALDSITEHEVMEAIRNLSHELTIIIIAHRLITVRDCDKIFLLQDGCLNEQGSYDELMKKNTEFRAMAIGRDEIDSRE